MALDGISLGYQTHGLELELILFGYTLEWRMAAWIHEADVDYHLVLEICEDLMLNINYGPERDKTECLK